MASPLLEQVFKPRSVADATNPLLAIQNQPPGPTMFPQPYPAADHAGPTGARATASSFPLPPVRPTTPTAVATDDDNFWPTTTTSGYNPMTGAGAPAQQNNPFASILAALGSLFRGQQLPAQGQGMSGMLNTPRGVDNLGNPVNRF